MLVFCCHISCLHSWSTRTQLVARSWWCHGPDWKLSVAARCQAPAPLAGLLCPRPLETVETCIHLAPNPCMLVAVGLWVGRHTLAWFVFRGQDLRLAVGKLNQHHPFLQTCRRCNCPKTPLSVRVGDSAQLFEEISRLEVLDRLSPIMAEVQPLAPLGLSQKRVAACTTGWPAITSELLMEADCTAGRKIIRLVSLRVVLGVRVNGALPGLALLRRLLPPAMLMTWPWCRLPCVVTAWTHCHSIFTSILYQAWRNLPN